MRPDRRLNEKLPTLHRSAVTAAQPRLRGNFGKRKNPLSPDCDKRGKKSQVLSCVASLKHGLMGEGLMRNAGFENASVQNLPVHSHCTVRQIITDRIRTAARDCVTIPPSLAGHGCCFFLTGYVQRVTTITCVGENTPIFHGPCRGCRNKNERQFNYQVNLRHAGPSAPTFSLWLLTSTWIPAPERLTQLSRERD